MRPFRRLRSLARLAALALPLLAAGAAADKRLHSWANPTPEALLRELATDRPDVTESPFTVDAGHVQFELDFASYTRDRSGGTRTTELGLAPVNLRLGLGYNFEAGIFIPPYVRVTEQPPGAAKSVVSGAGDAVLRAKVNLWGNDGGESAAGAIFDVKLPTAARGLGNGRLEGAVGLPFTCELAAGWSLGAMTTGNLVHDGGRYRGMWGNTLSFGRELAKDIGGFLEATSESGHGPHVCTINTGLTWRLGRHTQFDCGINVGVSRAAPDVQFFSGFARRF